MHVGRFLLGRVRGIQGRCGGWGHVTVIQINILYQTSNVKNFVKNDLPMFFNEQQMNEMIS